MSNGKETTCMMSIMYNL